ncbi:hypothetical protein ACRARG_17165 [Pseudooceanicola sp. C21-150M6]|uniref:hypothetical protein n=1 Tax=Pseudooceanicola sp. C21-150M6 TaxID=3434355 RepID=UPI003D7FD6E2
MTNSPADPAPQPRRLDRISGIAITLLVLTVILRDASQSDALRYAARAMLLIAVAVVSFRRSPPRLPFLIVGAILSAWIVATRPDWAAILGHALDSAAFVAAFFAALGTLRHAAELSASIARAALYLADRPPGKRYLALLAGGEAFSLLLGYGAISLLGSLVMSSTADEPNETIRNIRRRRMLLAVQHGFVSCIAWSPLSFGMVLCVQLVPGGTWAGALPYALVTAALFCTVGWTLDTLLKPRTTGLTVVPPDHGSRARDLKPLILLLVVLASLLTISHLVIGLTAAQSVMIIVPILSALWIATGDRQGPGYFGRLPQEARTFIGTRLPGFRGEIVLLSSASFLGTAGGLAIAPLVTNWVDLAALPSVLVLCSAIWVIPVMGYLGAHPLLSVSLLFPLLPAPEAMGVSPAVMICALTAGWSLSGATSPFTAATVLIGRFAGVSPLRVGIVWNGLFTLVSAVMATAWIVLLVKLA